MKKLFVFGIGAIFYLAALNLTAYIADQGSGWVSVSFLAAAMVGGTYTVDRMVG